MNTSVRSFPLRWFHRIVWSVAALVAAAALAMHAPGHVTMDSSVQLYEALIGRSVSWSPPMMSALLRWLGGGTQAMTGFVVISTLCTFAGLTLATYGAGRRSAARRPMREMAGLVVVALALLNPVIFLFVGIIWKDVLFAALFAFGAGLMLYASGRAQASRGRIAFLIAGCVLVPALLVRQQGILLAPLAMLVCAFGAAGGLAWPVPASARWRAALVLLLFVALWSALGFASRQAIAGSGEKSTSVGYLAIQSYDVTGLVAAGAGEGVTLPPSLADVEFRSAVLRSYSDDRLDYVLADTEVVKGFAGLSKEQVAGAWRAMIVKHPATYVAMKARQVGWLLDLYRLDRCLPVHVGVDGNSEFLNAAGVPTGNDNRDAELFQLSMFWRHFATYRHWFYLALLFGCIAWAWTQRRTFQPAETAVVASIAVGLGAFYASFSVTVLACDFRYLYPGLVGVSILLIFLITRQCLVRNPEGHP